jgi:hypothetical protein
MGMFGKMLEESRTSRREVTYHDLFGAGERSVWKL